MSDISTQRIETDEDDDETVFVFWNQDETQGLEIGTNSAGQGQSEDEIGENVNNDSIEDGGGQLSLSSEIAEVEPVERRKSARLLAQNLKMAPAPAATAATTRATRAAMPKTPRAKKDPKAKPNHPAWANMMTDAVKSLSQRDGSSIQAVKKYILANFKVDSDKITPHLRRGLKVALTSGKLIQVKGKGLSGSFRLGGGAKAKAAKSAVKAGAKETINIKKPSRKPKSLAKAKKAIKVAAAGTTAAPAAKPVAAPAIPTAKKAKTPAKPKFAKKPAAKKIIMGKSVKSPKSGNRNAQKSKTIKNAVKAATAK